MLTRRSFHALTLVAAVGIAILAVQTSSQMSLAQETVEPATSPSKSSQPRDVSQADGKKGAPTAGPKSSKTARNTETAKPSRKPATPSSNPQPKRTVENRPVSQLNPLRSLLRQWLFADEAVEQSGAQDKLRDPFSTTPKMQNTARLSGPQFVPLLNSKGVPKLQLRGLLQAKDEEKPVGLMAVEGFGTFLVTEGETISLHDGKSNLVLRIIKIQPNSISVEVGTLNQVIMVR